MSPNMTLSQVLCVVGLLLLIVSKTDLAYDGIQIKDGSHGGPVASDHLPTEPHLQQWSVQPVNPPDCPEQCSCKTNDAHHIITVDCSGRGLTSVPDLPQTTVILSLENNSIFNITCDSFKHLRSLQDLNLASNNITDLTSCLFQSQSGSLINLNISYNEIDYLDVKLFQDLSQLKTLDLSVNLIPHLANRTFSDLAQLIHLNLSFNLIKALEPDAFKGLRSLKTLSLFNNQLDNPEKSFHKDVFQDLVALETLDVKANGGHLDDAISSLKNLSHLYMTFDYQGQDPYLGTGYRQLVNLQTLHASDVDLMSGGRYKQSAFCAIFSVPWNFFENIQTEKSFELYMSGCNIIEIENDTFNALPTLVTLDLSNNSIIDFGKEPPSWMASLINTSITSLDLSNTLGHLGKNIIIPLSWFRYLVKTNLKTLSLKWNSIWDLDLPTDLDSTSHSPFPTTIENLVLSGNKMSLYHWYLLFINVDIPGFKLKELQVCDQQLNWPIQKNSQKMADTNTLGNFSSGHGNYKRAGEAAHSELSDGHRLNDSHTILNISPNETVDSRQVGKDEDSFGNVWRAPGYCFLIVPDQVMNVCLPADLKVICARSTMYNSPKTVLNIRIVNNTVLSHVVLSDNFLTSWLGPVENVPSLTFLDLSGNFCDDVDFDFFTPMASLEILILKKNSLGSVLVTDVRGLIFSALTNLKVLDVSQNNIQDLSRLAFVNNTNLETLDLSYNRLTEFQPTLSAIRNLSFLDLSRNLLPGLSEKTCQELKLLKSRNKTFTVNLLNNRLLFTCDYLPFLDLIFSNPHIFYSVEHLKFRFINGTQLTYKDVDHHFPILLRECLIQRYFDVILITFFIVVGAVAFCAVIYHKRWKLRYLYYTSRRRMHIGEQHAADYIPHADAFITYDQDDLRWRRFMQRTFLPGLNQRNITYILGETDFPGGDVMTHVTGAVVGTRKTVILLSADIFDDHHREFEMNLSIMRELDTRSLKIVPIFVEEVDLALYPREIEIFLRNQWERCLCYSDTDDFWDDFVDAVREDN